MAEATRDVPTDGLREYIARQTRVGDRLGAEVTGFALHLRSIKERFDQQVDPLGLSDDDYFELATECGLVGLLGTTHGMAEVLQQAAAA